MPIDSASGTIKAMHSGAAEPALAAGAYRAAQPIAAEVVCALLDTATYWAVVIVRRGYGLRRTPAA